MTDFVKEAFEAEKAMNRTLTIQEGLRAEEAMKRALEKASVNSPQKNAIEIVTIESDL